MYLVRCDGNCEKETQLQNLLLLLDGQSLSERLHNGLEASQSVCVDSSLLTAVLTKKGGFCQLS